MNKRKKVLAIIIVSVIAISVFFTGTFAWQSISQLALNEVAGNPNPGGRLHDDFNGRDKKVYVENFTDENDGTAIYARVRLKEYMEIGQGAGSKRDDITVKKIGKTDADVKDTETWITHKHSYADDDSGENLAHYEFHDYWKWTLGGKTAYLPTFNKNKDSLEADINGTFAGPDNDPETDEDRYADYKEYTLGEEISGISKYDADDNSVDEGEEAKVEVNYIEKEEKHIVKETLDAKVVTMEQWKVLGCPIGDYWVYDVDGWAYWAKPINPGEATGLLLSGIELVKEPTDEWYYAINAEGQFATAGDWGKKEDQTGFFKDGITDDALSLLNKVANLLPGVKEINIKGGLMQYVRAGQTTEFTADVYVDNAENNAKEKYIMWSITPDSGTLSRNKFTPDSSMVGKTFRITATSAYNKDKSSYIDVYVYPSDAIGVVDGEKDGKKYVKYPDNTYREIKENQELGNFISAGLDEIIGNEDDIENVVKIDNPDIKFGDKFIGPDVNGHYLAKGADGLLGTADDIKVSGSPWPQNITDILADSITIKTVSGSNKVTVNKKSQLIAEVKLKGEIIANQDINWTISGNVDDKTKIDENGVLTVGENEKVGGVITVYASSATFSGLKENIVLSVKNLEYEDIPSIVPGSKMAVTIDGIDWYVLAKSNGKALLFAKQPLDPQKFGNYNWSSSASPRGVLELKLRAWPTLSQYAVVTKNNTRVTDKDRNVLEQWEETDDKIFLLTEADVFGTSNGNKTEDARDYSYGNKPILPKELRPTSGALRSPLSGLYAAGTYRVSYYIAGMNSVDNYSRIETAYASVPLYPAIWVTLPQASVTETNASQVDSPQ